MVIIPLSLLMRIIDILAHPKHARSLHAQGTDINLTQLPLNQTTRI